MRIKHILTFPHDEEGVAQRRALLPPDLLQETTQVDMVPIRDAGALLFDSYYNAALFEPFIIAAGVRAEEEGYDAVCVDTVSDQGVSALRSRLTIPVLGAGQCAYAVATMLGRRFSVLTRWERWIWLHDASLDAYGLRGRCASIRAPQLPRDAVAALAGKHAGDAGPLLESDPAYLPAFLTEARKAIDEDGADVLIVASMTMRDVHQVLVDAVEVPVIDPGPLALTMLETWVRNGLAHSKKAFPSPVEIQDERFLGLLGRE